MGRFGRTSSTRWAALSTMRLARKSSYLLIRGSKVGFPIGKQGGPENNPLNPPYQRDNFLSPDEDCLALCVNPVPETP